ncbi:hypothetical protein AVEN_64476-1 [Araneus ventricosus]|uniref:Uncharacterized protein n=1 Tax=Araneus ventricosus TaxID=182803 RepID=A0A4Y2QXG6_ARAVE|nr:hypothetical protein AVEN_64476-1 [Araneus ventricosus]
MLETAECHLVVSRMLCQCSWKTQIVTHEIELVSEESVLSKPCRASPRQNEFMRKEIQKMLAMKIIEVRYSDYTSPMVLVEAPGKEPRPCVCRLQ